MANFAPSYIMLSTILMLSFYSGYCSRSYVGGVGEMNTMASNDKTWCVAKSGADDGVLQSNIDFACAKVDCAAIQSGGPCFEPNTLVNHASYAMNSYYQTNGKDPQACDFKNSGHVIVTDPSYGSCVYPSS